MLERCFLKLVVLLSYLHVRLVMIFLIAPSKHISLKPHNRYLEAVTEYLKEQKLTHAFIKGSPALSNTFLKWCSGYPKRSSSPGCLAISTEEFCVVNLECASDHPVVCEVNRYELSPLSIDNWGETYTYKSAEDRCKTVGGNPIATTLFIPAYQLLVDCFIRK